MSRPRIPRVVVGWRVIAKVARPDGTEALQAISRIFHVKQAAMDYREAAVVAGSKEPYVAAVERPERKTPDLVDP